MRGASTVGALMLAALLTGCAQAAPPGVSAPASTSVGVQPTTSAAMQLYAGTEPAVAPRGTVTEGVIRTSDGRERSYRLFVPEGGLGVAPLLVALHGGLGSAGQFAANSDFDGLATSNRFVVVYPNGVGLADSGSARTWNGGDCCGPAARQRVDDVAFIRALVLAVADDQAIDPNRIYVTGHSNGGILALRLACESADLVAAVAVQSAALGVPACRPARPMSSLQIHGTADANLPIAGGKGSGPAGVAFTPPREAAVTLAAAAGCGPDPTASRLGRELVIERWPGCPSGVAVEFITVTGAGHAWMGHPAQSAAAERLVGPPYQGLDSSRAIWSFLAAHPRTLASGTVVP